MSEQTIDIFDRRTSEFVEAILHDELDPIRFVETERVWGPYRLEAVRKLIYKGTPPEDQPEHWKWNWESKAGALSYLAYRGIGIECEGHMQGLMLLKMVGMAARLAPDKGKPIIYVHFIESAPWNVKKLEPMPRFGAIGVRLIEAAIRTSIAEGFGGRVGLHSLPQSEDFYRNTCKMQDLGLDVTIENLRYFELERSIAQSFLTGGKS